MEIICYIADSCSSREQLLENLEAALERVGGASGDYRLLNEKEAAKLAIGSSPTVLIGGRDVAGDEVESGSG